VSKTVEFENTLSDLITETFTTKQELQEAIDYFRGVVLSGLLEEHMQYME